MELHYRSLWNDFLTADTTLASRTTVKAVPIVGWNVQSATLPTNPVTSQINSNILTSFSTQTRTSPSANGHQLSNGAKPGIGASAGVGMLIVMIFIAWTVILKRKTRNLSAEIEINRKFHTQSHGVDANGVFNLSRSCEHCDSRPHELDHENVRELDDSQINELPHRSLHKLDPVSVPVEMSIV